MQNRTETAKKCRIIGSPGYVPHACTILLALALTGCSAARPLKGGRAITSIRPGAVLHQSLSQSENPSQASKQDQEIIRTRTYTLPPGTRIEQ